MISPSLSPTSPPIEWSAIVASVVTGVVSNLFRVTCVYACHALESYETGCAGIIGNILHAEYIAMVALLALAFFGEVMATMELIGASVIGGAIIGVAVVKALRQKWEKKRRDVGAEKDEEETKDAKDGAGEKWAAEEDVELENVRGRKDDGGKEQGEYEVMISSLRVKGGS